MTRPRFTGSFTQQEPIPEEGITAAVEVLRSGRLHRYNTAPGEESEAAKLERDYAAWQGSRYCLAVASGGQAMQIALRAAGVRPGDRILTNAFTLAPVPGAIAAVGAEPVLVEITESLVLDLDDLAAKARASGATVLLLSHMRGHLCDMDRLAALAEETGLTMIEDCAHTMGAQWNGRRSGSFGLAGCFSTQTYKHLNAGEGGLLTSDDPAFMARAIMLSGSYMLYERHGAGPAPEAYADIRLDTPNMSARMDNLRAAILRPQLARIDDAIRRWNERYDRVAARLAGHDAIRLPERPPQELYVGSSIQFLVPGLSAQAARAFVADCATRGVELKWFGAAEPVGFTSAHRSWRYVPAQSVPATDSILSGLFDMRLPLTFGLDDCDVVAQHILDAAAALRS
ncbi:MAG: DegT/DnrJ/EryC1/StrS family aminotransferase [Salinarimonas sp.]